MQIDRKSNGCIMIFALLVFLLGTSGCTYFSEQSKMERKGREFVHSFAEYQPTSKELEGLLSEAVVASPSITPVCYIAALADYEFILRMRGLLPTAVPYLDREMIKEFAASPLDSELRLVESESISILGNGISGIAYWPRKKFGFHDVETGRSGYVTADYRLRQLDAISYGYALVDHEDQDHIFYDTYSSAERFAKENKRGYWGLSSEEQRMADTDREKQMHIQSEIWKMLEDSEWETISVDSSELKKFWAICGDPLDKTGVTILSYDFKGQDFENQFKVEPRGVLLTGIKELDSKARKSFYTADQYCYLLKDSVERVSDQKIKGILYHPTYSLTGKSAAQAGELHLDTYRTWQPLAVALGYCVVDHDDKTHPLYETLVRAEKLAKQFEVGYWGAEGGGGSEEINP